MSASEETALGRAILDAERAVRTALEGLEPAERVLGTRGRRPERTRAGAVERLEAAVMAVCEAARADKSDRTLGKRAAEARKAWEKAHQLRWELAVSARRVVPPEARKIAAVSGVDEEDLVNEGFIGLLRAATRFDPERGIRFATYARWWARAQMTRAVDSGGRSVRLTGVAVEQLRNLRRVQQRFEKEGVSPTIADLATEAGLTEDRARELLSQGQVMSLEEPVDEGRRVRRMHDVVADDGASQDDDVSNRELVERLRRAVAALPDERQRYILTRRFGLEDDTVRTLSEVGEELGLSRERVRQIEKRAFAWIREHGGFDVQLPQALSSTEAA